jgi:hypothetical protein
MFFNENDIFEIRLNQHWDFVDKFIVVEAGETHTGLKKPYNFDHERDAAEFCIEVIGREPNDIFMFKLQLFAFKFNAVHKSWDKTDTTGMMMNYKTMKEALIGTRREHRQCTKVFNNAGWHFCSMDKYSDGVMIQAKYQAWAHSRDVESGKQVKFDLTKEEALARLLADYSIEKVVEINYNNLPAYIVDNQEKFSDYIVPHTEFLSTTQEIL